MKNKVLLFFLAVVCFATTFANNRPPGQKIGDLSSVIFTSPPVEQTEMNAMMMSQTRSSCEIINNEVTMMAYQRLGLYQGQLCLPASDNRFGVMQKINEMMLKNQQILGYASLKLNFTDCMVNLGNSLTAMNGGTNWYRVLKISSVANSSSFMANKEKRQGFNLNRGLVLKCPMNNSSSA